jgi:hypothetical protein
VEDDHVDRPGVEVRQRMKLTGTNSSIGLIVLIACAHRQANAKRSSGTMMRRRVLRKTRLRSHQLLNNIRAQHGNVALAMRRLRLEVAGWPADVPFERLAKRKGISAPEKHHSPGLAR